MESLFLSGRFDFLDFFIRLFFNADKGSLVQVLVAALEMVGFWKMFEKSGIKGWWALIPAAREYQLGRCAGREQEGRMLCVLSALSTLLNVFGLMPYVALSRSGMSREVAMTLASVIGVALALPTIIYSIRVYSGLIEVYGVRKRWMWLWIIPYLNCIPPLVWGFNPKYQPEWKVEDIKAELARLAHQGSATVLDEGLTVNLRERTATEFFQKKVLLRDIHMTIPQGHMVLLLGGSGAGKTTYLNAVNGYEKANAEVMLNGTNMYKQYKKMQYEVGFVPQSEMMRGKDTVLNTLLDAAKLRLPREVTARQRRQRVDEVMEIFGLTPVKNNLVEKLSGGQKKRLSISMEFISNPSLFILDEPDSGLDGGLRPGRGHGPGAVRAAAQDRRQRQDRHRHHPHAGPRDRPVRRRDRAGQGQRPHRAAGLVRQHRGRAEVLPAGHHGADRQVRQPQGGGRRRPGRRVCDEVREGGGLT